MQSCVLVGTIVQELETLVQLNVTLAPTILPKEKAIALYVLLDIFVLVGDRCYQKCVPQDLFVRRLDCPILLCSAQQGIIVSMELILSTLQILLTRSPYLAMLVLFVLEAFRVQQR